MSCLLSHTHIPLHFSCFLLTMTDDSIDGIYDTLKQCAMISKSAGGECVTERVCEYNMYAWVCVYSMYFCFPYLFYAYMCGLTAFRYWLSWLYPAMLNFTQCTIALHSFTLAISSGIGVNVHNIRAKGSYIWGTGGSSNGLVPMLRVFNNTARYVDQGGNKVRSDWPGTTSNTCYITSEWLSMHFTILDRYLLWTFIWNS